MKKCLRCGEKNGDEYGYCSLCGAILPEIEVKPTLGDYGDEKGEDIANREGEISVYEMKTFVGKNGDDIVKRFVFMQKTGRKATFCLSVFLLGLFFGLAGVAAWFLYRKMAKPAVWIYLSAFLFKIIGVVTNLRLLAWGFSGIISAVHIAISLGDLEHSFNYFAEVVKTLVMTSSAADVACFAVKSALILIFTFFSVAMYKKHCIKRILTLKSGAASKTNYINKLKSEGGTSVARVVGGSLIYIGSIFFLSLVLIICAVVGVL